MKSLSELLTAITKKVIILVSEVQTTHDACMCNKVLFHLNQMTKFF